MNDTEQGFARLAQPRLLIAGFGFLFLLTLAGTGVSLFYLNLMHDHLEEVVDSHIRRIDRVHDMHTIVRERMVRLNWIYLENDPFMQDELFQEFLSLGNRFIVLRAELEAVADESAEREALADFHRETVRATAVVEDSIAFYQEGLMKQGRRHMLDRAVPAQENVIHAADALHHIYERRGEEIVSHARQAYGRALNTVIGLSIVALALVVVTATLVVSRSQRDRRRLVAQIETRRRAEDELRALSVGLEKEVTERTAQLWEIAHHDHLTGLPNRGLFLDRLNQAISFAQRRGGAFAVALIDLDNFKQVNDTYGHAAGDQLLVEVANRFRRAIRKSDTVARYAGDEFVGIFPDVGTPDEARVTLKKLRECFATPFTLDDTTWHLTMSIGLAFYPHDAMDADGLLQAADKAMYTVKQRGRDGYSFSSDGTL
ncbi:MAG: diguanylate cyclase [Gammaproteobacteria bacterium]|nr:diguanylate cyclase [Gammaproteobacteria bacterium]MCW8972291.1 diguanylate cyclase [Gammaproteobacteria bacterium]MCW8993745.1 diguanylate cyclase [Gammaproteobacteria bacterium]